MSDKNHFEKESVSLLNILKVIFYIIFVESVVEFLKAIKTIVEELANMLVNAPYFKSYHSFVCFGLIATTDIFLSKNSTNFYTEKSEELKKILSEISEIKIN